VHAGAMVSGESSWKLGHRPALDGLRGVAILLVLLGHALPGLPVAGPAGVSVFFALSGFLITTVLLETRDRIGRPGLGGFYLRRARRLFPAVGVFLAVVAIADALWWPWLTRPADLLASVFYVRNIQLTHQAADGALPHLWSLSVEEQFYLLWPLALMLLVRRSVRAASLAAVGAVVVSVAVRLWFFETGALWTSIYYGSVTNACLLAAGCAVAFVARSGRSLPAVLFWPLLATAATAGLAPFGRAAMTWVPVFAAAGAALALLAAVGVRSPSTPAWLNLVGRRSYALYLWHYPLVVVVPQHLDVSRAITVPAGVALAWGAACASWVLVERSALRPRAGRPHVAAPLSEAAAA